MTQCRQIEQACPLKKVSKVDDSARPGFDVEPGTSPLVITSRDTEQGCIDQAEIESLARSYILLE